MLAKHAPRVFIGSRAYRLVRRSHFFGRARTHEKCNCVRVRAMFDTMAGSFAVVESTFEWIQRPSAQLRYIVFRRTIYVYIMKIKSKVIKYRN
jgi:hypothetical protein